MGVDSRSNPFAPGLPPGRPVPPWTPGPPCDNSKGRDFSVGGHVPTRTHDVLHGCEHHPGDNPGANLKPISHRCHPILVAFVWELTKETIDLPLGCLQGGSQPCPTPVAPNRTRVLASRSSLTSLLTSDDTREAHIFLESDQILNCTRARAAIYRYPGGGAGRTQGGSMRTAFQSRRG